MNEQETCYDWAKRQLEEQRRLEQIAKEYQKKPKERKHGAQTRAAKPR